MNDFITLHCAVIVKVNPVVVWKSENTGNIYGTLVWKHHVVDFTKQTNFIPQSKNSSDDNYGNRNVSYTVWRPITGEKLKAIVSC